MSMCCRPSAVVGTSREGVRLHTPGRTEVLVLCAWVPFQLALMMRGRLIRINDPVTLTGIVLCRVVGNPQASPLGTVKETYRNARHCLFCLG